VPRTSQRPIDTICDMSVALRRAPCYGHRHSIPLDGVGDASLTQNQTQKPRQEEKRPSCQYYSHDSDLTP
jgi:hypothetical protein